MAGNFEFLKKVDEPLFEIIHDAEELYRSEFFEQCMTQTRRFGEIVCKNVLGTKRTNEITFDAMLATLKDYGIGGSVQEKEFIDDLYFLKKHGNQSAHSIKVNQDGMEALECLKRAFEISVSYCVYYKKASQTILKLKYDTEMLITGKKSNTLCEKYENAKKKVKNNKPKKRTPQYCSVKSQKRDKNNLFWIFVGISACVSLTLLVIISLL